MHAYCSSLFTCNVPRGLRRWLVSCLALALSSQALATTFLELDLESLLRQSEIVVFGRVLDSRVENRDGDPWTVVRILPIRDLLAELASDSNSDNGNNDNSDDEDDSISLAFYGGTLADGSSLSVSGMPTFNNNEEVLLLAYDASYYSPIVGFSQGLWRLAARGFVDEQGRVLSLDEEGMLLRDGEGGGTEDILDALRAMLETL